MARLRGLGAQREAQHQPPLQHAGGEVAAAALVHAVRQGLDFGGVLINEVPTWRADQQPYGGLRDSGNTREGPAFSVKEMTEIRMVVMG